MKKMYLLLMTGLLVVAEAHAGANYTGKITKVWAEPAAGDYVLLSVDGTPPFSGGATCASNSVYHFAFGLTGDVGKALLSMALTAYSAGKTVRLIGVGQCSFQGNVEDLANMRLE